MLTPWEIGPLEAMLAAILFAMALSFPLARAARLLPPKLDDSLAGAPSAIHRRHRAGFWAVTPFVAIACVRLLGATPLAAAAIAFVLTLLALAWIDAETGFLPDMLSLPLLWLGLLVNLGGALVPLQDAVLGAVAGYLVLWCVYWLFRLCTGREGMGHGDFKLLAALGAWLGWAALPWVLLISSSLALAVVFILRLAGRRTLSGAISFGPYLAIAGILMLFRLSWAG
ncbi:prepilin peptidase [Alcaligenaceae bacterium]|nr:prepilin peptidase [Alcaligenaceae bacterium]